MSARKEIASQIEEAATEDYPCWHSTYCRCFECEMWRHDEVAEPLPSVVIEPTQLGTAIAKAIVESHLHQPPADG